ncbi:2-hydroxyacyl-CoA dehydratase family protein [Sphingosinicella terrae]|uniref:2-hydroxyacyl-CoA dehydratase family protein n=1 Tax=Sphingosinicella terrae TaxID=2172047 RepID=UPI00254741CA|nr:2-hydroxyacyl-CoA dehydratase family protein [Sphingosinicella terrae]
MNLTLSIDAVLDDPLAAARGADRAIGHVGMDVPDDVLLAPGLTAIHLPWQADRATPAADCWLESSFPGPARSILQDWADGRFDSLDKVVFTRGEDSAQRLYYYVCELQRRGQLGGPEPLIFDVARIERPTSVVRTTEAVRKLAAALGLGDDALRQGIDRANRRRALFRDLEARRSGPGSRHERFARATLFAPVEPLPPTDEPPAGGRVLLAGSAPPDDRLHLAVEAAGWTVVREVYDRAPGRLAEPEVPADADDPAAAIGAQVHASPWSARSFVDRAAFLRGEAGRAAADAVILWLVSEEEGLVWHVPNQRRALEAAGLPHLSLANRRWDAADGAADEIRHFLEGLDR